MYIVCKVTWRRASSLYVMTYHIYMLSRYKSSGEESTLWAQHVLYRFVRFGTAWYCGVLRGTVLYGCVRLCMALHGYGFVRFGYGYGRLVFLYRVRFCTVLYGWVRLGTGGYGWVRLGTVGYAVGYGWVRWVRLSTVLYALVRFCTAVRLCTGAWGRFCIYGLRGLTWVRVCTGGVRVRMGLYGSLWVCAGLYWSVRVSMGTDNYI